MPAEDDDSLLNPGAKGDQAASKVSPRYRADLAEVHVAHGGYGRAVVELQKALNEAQNAGLRNEIQGKLAHALALAGRHGDAADVSRKALAGMDRATAATPDGKLRAAQLSERAMRYDEAARRYRDVLDSTKDERVARQARDGLLLSWKIMGVLQKQLDSYDDRARKNPADFDSLLLLIEGQRVLTGSVASALPYLKRALKIHPDNQSLLEQVGRISLEAKDYDRAIPTFTRLIALAPDREAEFLGLIAHAYTAKGDREAAIATARLMIGKPPFSPMMQVELARIYRMNGKPADSVTVIKRLLVAPASAVEDEFLRIELARSYCVAGRWDKAKELLDGVIAAPVVAAVATEAGRALRDPNLIGCARTMVRTSSTSDG